MAIQIDDIFRMANGEPTPVPQRPGLFVQALNDQDWRVWAGLMRAVANDDEAAMELAMADLVRQSLCDKDGNRLLADQSPADVAKRLGRPSLQILFRAARGVSMIKPEDVEAEKKDSGEIQTSDSGSSSAAPMASSPESSAAASTAATT